MYQNDIVILILQIRNEKYIYRLKRNAVKSTDNLARQLDTREKHRPIPHALWFSENKIDLLKYHETRAFMLTRHYKISACDYDSSSL